MRRLIPVLCLAVAHLAACQPCNPQASLTPGTVIARINDSRWQAKKGVWFESGTSVNLETETSGEWAISMVAQKTDDGTDASEALEAEEFPIEFTLGDAGDGAWALAWPSLGAALSSADALEAGWFTIANRQDDDLLGCFEFDAGTGETTATVVNGTFRIPLRS